MKTFKLAIASLIAAVAIAGQAGAYTIDDNYIGGDPTHGYSHVDVVGDYKYYDIAGMNVSTSGKSMTVDIFTSFVSQVSSAQIWNDQTHIGDLFLGTGGWKPSGYANNKYVNDTASSNQTIWDYVAVLDRHAPTTKYDSIKSREVKIYSTRDGSFVKSNLGTLNTNQWIYRADQYVQFRPSDGAVALASGTWNIIDGIIKNGIDYDDLKISFDYSTIPAAGNDWAYHWAMTCGNDVIEGQTHVPPVPEPSTLVLLGAGLLGVGLARRRSRK